MWTAGRKRWIRFVTFFIMSFIVCLMVTAAYITNRSELEKVQMQQLAASKSEKVCHVLIDLLYKTHILEAFVQQSDGKIEDFESIASTVLDNPAIKNVLLAPGGKVQYVYPLEGNEAVMDHDFLSERDGNKEAILARDTGQLVLGGPFDLVQGGEALVGRLPVYIENGELSQFWGIASVTLNYPQALEAAELDLLRNEGFAFEIWRISPDTGERQVIANSDYDYSKNVNYAEHSMDILNAEWYFRLSPIRSWYEFPETWVCIIVGAFISCLIGFVFLHNYDLKNMKQELEILSFKDMLTGVDNRRGGFRKLEQLIVKKKKFVLGYVDLNRFKYINDKYGHDAGDKALKYFTGAVMKLLDNSKQLFIRIGGDEFVIVFKDASNIADTQNFFTQLDHTLENEMLKCYEEQIHLTYCVGCAVFPDDGGTADELITAADEKMYRLKLMDERRK